MAGSLYIWIMGAIFLGVVLLLAGMGLLFWIGHRLEKKETGATHGFLEIPENQRSRPARRSSELPPPTSPIPPTPPTPPDKPA